MPNTKSAIRRVRRVEKQTYINKIRKSKYRSIIKDISSLIALKKKEEARTTKIWKGLKLLKLYKKIRG